MDLETLNKEYILWKNEFKNASKELESFEKELKDLQYDLRSADGRLATAEKNKDKVEIAKEKNTIKEIAKKIENLKKNIEKTKTQVEKMKSNIDSKIANIQKDPELQKHMSKALESQYKQKLEKANKENDALNKNKENLENRKKGILNLEKLSQSKKPKNIQNDLKELLEAKAQLKALKTKLESLPDGDPTEKDIKANIYDLGQKIKSNPALNYIRENNLEIGIQDIDFLSDNIVTGKKGLDFDATFKGVKGSLDKELKNINTKIENKGKYIDDIKVASLLLSQDVTKETAEPEKTAEPTEPGELIKPEEKLKWYQFIKRFKNWKERRNQPKLEESTEKKTVESKPEEKETPSSPRDFVETLKSELAKDMSKNYMDKARDMRLKDEKAKKEAAKKKEEIEK